MSPREARWEARDARPHSALRSARAAVVLASVILVMLPTFFDVYRGAAFNTVPRDDYAPFLLALMGEQGEPPTRQQGLLPPAPFGYRVLSVAAAIPAYLLLPYYPFSGLANPDEPYLRATAALAMLSFVCMLLTALVMYLTARRHLHSSPMASLLVGLLSLGLFQYLSLSGVDPLAVLMVAVLLYVVDSVWLFAPLIIGAAAVNEKILVIFGFLFVARFLASVLRRDRLRAFRFWPQMVATVIGVSAYALMRFVLRLPGNEGQLNPDTWFEAAINTILVSLSLKGIVQNGLPLIMMALVVGLALVSLRGRHEGRHRYSRSDAAVPIGLGAIGLAIGAEVTVGRLVMHSFPLFVPLLSVAIDRHLGDGSSGIPVTGSSAPDEPPPETT